MSNCNHLCYLPHVVFLGILTETSSSSFEHKSRRIPSCRLSIVPLPRKTDREALLEDEVKVPWKKRTGQGTKAFHHNSRVSPPSCTLWPAFSSLQRKHFAVSGPISLLPSIKRRFTLLWPVEVGIWSSYSWKLHGRGWGRTALLSLHLPS